MSYLDDINAALDFPANGADLIHALRVERGIYPDDGPSAVGAVALADWLCALPRNFNRFRTTPLSPATIERILSGELLPTAADAAAIARMTDGLVTGDMFDLSAQSAGSHETPEASSPRASGSGGAENAPLGSAAPFIEWMGVAGQTVAGPLFRVLAPTSDHPFFVMMGLGVSVCLDRASARQLHGTLGFAIEGDRG